MADVDQYLRKLYEGRPPVTMTKGKRILALEKALGTFVPNTHSEATQFTCRQHDHYSEYWYELETTEA
ncbi:hypothetical protein [Bacillus sp. JCM 19041]|uniref:hypothetical protein n=1 Tax=Bacillus sp. JCM 19041 TaxID=1460637 RepID=UPI0006D15EB1